MGLLFSLSPEVVAELHDEYLSRADILLEHLQEYPQLLEAETVLMEHTFIVKIKDLSWIRDVISPWEMASLSLAFAEELYPDDEWEVLEEGDSFVVTNSNQSIVFDMEHFDRLSGAASLVKAGVKEGMPDTAFLELHRLAEEQNEKAQRSLEILQRHLAKDLERDQSPQGSVVSLNQETPPEN